MEAAYNIHVQVIITVPSTLPLQYIHQLSSSNVVFPTFKSLSGFSRNL